MKAEYKTKEEKRDIIIDEVYWFIEKLEKKYNADITYNIDDITIYENGKRK